MDSCNMNMDDWAKLARDIEKHYDHFDGFVILHGTDTMCYTASALSFMLENLGKPVILTGAQVANTMSFFPPYVYHRYTCSAMHGLYSLLFVILAATVRNKK